MWILASSTKRRVSVKRALGTDVSLSRQAMLAPSLRINNAGDGTFSRIYAHTHSLIIVFICKNWSHFSRFDRRIKSERYRGISANIPDEAAKRARCLWYSPVEAATTDRAPLYWEATLPPSCSSWPSRSRRCLAIKRSNKPTPVYTRRSIPTASTVKAHPWICVGFANLFLSWPVRRKQQLDNDWSIEMKYFFFIVAITFVNSSSGHGRPLYITSGDTSSTNSKLTIVRASKFTEFWPDPWVLQQA